MSALPSLLPTAGLRRSAQVSAVGQHAANPLGTAAASPVHVVAVIAVAGMASVDGQHFRAAGFLTKGFALALCSRGTALAPRSPRAQQSMFGVNKMVARDGIEPPTPAFSGLRSTN